MGGGGNTVDTGLFNSKGRGALLHTYLPPSKCSVAGQVSSRDLEPLFGVPDIRRDKPTAVVRPVRRMVE